MSETSIDKFAGSPSTPDIDSEQPHVSNSFDDADLEPDETTGASPGTAQACDDLGLNSLKSNLERFNIKPPGQS